MTYTVTDGQVLEYLRAWLWPFLRVSGLILASPILGTRALPRRIRMLFVLLLTMVVMPLTEVTAAAAQVAVLSAPGLLIGAQQLVIGTALGLVLRAVFVVFEFAGQIVAQQMGLGFAAMVDPQSGTQVPVISQFYTVLATLLFFATDAHLRLIRLLADSFHLMPFGTALPRGALAEVMRWSGDLLGLAVLLSLPIIIVLLIVNLAFAFMSRAAPQLNIFSIGFPVTLLCGVLILTLNATSIAANVEQTLDAGFSAAYRLLAPR